MKFGQLKCIKKILNHKREHKRKEYKLTLVYQAYSRIRELREYKKLNWSYLQGFSLFQVNGVRNLAFMEWSGVEIP